MNGWMTIKFGNIVHKMVWRTHFCPPQTFMLPSGWPEQWSDIIRILFLICAILQFMTKCLLNYWLSINLSCICLWFCANCLVNLITWYFHTNDFCLITVCWLLCKTNIWKNLSVGTDGIRFYVRHLIFHILVNFNAPIFKSSALLNMNLKESRGQLHQWLINQIIVTCKMFVLSK